MTSTSDVATAPTSPGAAARLARSQRSMARGWRVLRTGVAFVTFGVGAIVVAGIVWPVRLLDRRAAGRREVRTQRVVHGASRLFVWWMKRLGILRLSWIGAERLQARAPRLIVANHPSLIDVVLLLARLPQADCIVKKAARRNPFMRSLVTSAGYLANDDGDALVDACADRINHGRSVVLFPEGTRSPREGLHRFQRGAAHIALKSGCAIVPAADPAQGPGVARRAGSDGALRAACRGADRSRTVSGRGDDTAGGRATAHRGFADALRTTARRRRGHDMNQPEVSKDEIFKRLRDVLVAGFELRDEQIVPTARLIDDLELDSLDLVDFAVRLEQQVDLEIAEDELKGIKTVQDIVDLAYQKLNAGRP